MAGNFLGIDDSPITNIGTRKPRSSAEVLRSASQGIGSALQSARDFVSPQSNFIPDTYNPLGGFNQNKLSQKEAGRKKQIGMLGSGVTQRLPSDFQAIPDDVAKQAVDTNTLRHMKPIAAIGNNIQNIAPSATELGDYTAEQGYTPEGGILPQFQSTGNPALGIGQSPANITDAAQFRELRDSTYKPEMFGETNFADPSIGKYFREDGAMPFDVTTAGANQSPEEYQQAQAQLTQNAALLANRNFALENAPRNETYSERKDEHGNVIQSSGSSNIANIGSVQGTDPLASERLGLSQQRLSHDVAQSKKQKPIEYGFKEGRLYPKSGEGAESLIKQQKVDDAKTQLSSAVMSNPDRYSKKHLQEAKDWLGFIRNKQSGAY